MLTPMRTDPDTRAYTDRRRSEDKTNRKMRRCLKRYASRQIYHTLTAADGAPQEANSSGLTRL